MSGEKIDEWRKRASVGVNTRVSIEGVCAEAASPPDAFESGEGNGGRPSPKMRGEPAGRVGVCARTNELAARTASSAAARTGLLCERVRRTPLN
jgi:hypothetical protein